HSDRGGSDHGRLRAPEPQPDPARSGPGSRADRCPLVGRPEARVRLPLTRTTVRRLISCPAAEIGAQLRRSLVFSPLRILLRKYRAGFGDGRDKTPIPHQANSVRHEICAITDSPGELSEWHSDEPNATKYRTDRRPRSWGNGWSSHC